MSPGHLDELLDQILHRDEPEDGRAAALRAARALRRLPLGGVGRGDDHHHVLVGALAEVHRLVELERRRHAHHARVLRGRTGTGSGSGTGTGAQVVPLGGPSEGWG